MRTRLQRSVGRELTKFVGREREMEALRHAAEQARGGRGQIAAAMAEPGVGKSRVFFEFKATSAAGWMVLETFSISHGKASAYLPAIDLLRKAGHHQELPSIGTHGHQRLHIAHCGNETRTTAQTISLAQPVACVKLRIRALRWPPSEQTREALPKVPRIQPGRNSVPNVRPDFSCAVLDNLLVAENPSASNLRSDFAVDKPPCVGAMVQTVENIGFKRRRRTMKYLVLVSVKPHAQPNPEILSRHKDWVLDQVKSGVMESAYTFAGSGNGMCIINAQNPEQLNDITTSAPGFPICDLDVRPLADFAKQMDRMGALFKNMR